MKNVKTKVQEIGEDFFSTVLKEVENAQKLAAQEAKTKTIERFRQAQKSEHVFIIPHNFDSEGECWISVFASYADALQYIADRDGRPRIEQLQVARLLKAARKDPPTLEKVKRIRLPRQAYWSIEMVSWETCLERLSNAKYRRDRRDSYSSCSSSHGPSLAYINSLIR